MQNTLSICQPWSDGENPLPLRHENFTKKGFCVMSVSICLGVCIAMVVMFVISLFM